MQEELRAVARMLAELTDRLRRLLSAFLSGVMRGIGIALGFSVAGAALVWILQSAARANLPGISDFLAQVVTMVQLRIQ